MNDPLLILCVVSIVFLILALVIIALLFERGAIIGQHIEKENKLLEENSRLVKAVIAKNANDYVMTTSIDKVAPEAKPPSDPDLIPEETLSDEEFMAAINKTAAAKS